MMGKQNWKNWGLTPKFVRRGIAWLDYPSDFIDKKTHLATNGKIAG